MTQSADSRVAAADKAADHDAIAQVVQLYIDGAAKGDVAKLTEAFHEDARMFGAAGDSRYDGPIGEMFTDPPADTGNYRARIVSILQTGDVAIAELAEDGYWGTVSFVDYFSLARINGTWKIVNKVFAHTGGEMPQG
jgi:hypothetical protein